MTDDKEILHEVILGYRKVISQRYDYDHIISRYEIPDSFDKKRIDTFKQYFLNHIYPHPEKRDELDDAFNSLDGYIKQPERLIRLLLDSASLVFKYGRHLPKILTAGIKAMKSFRAANQFEKKLVEAALESDLQAPYEKEDIDQLTGSLSPEEIESFIKNNEALFETLHDRKLVDKIKEIVGHLIGKMKKRPDVYSEVEIRGLEIGQEIIVEGDALFDSMTVEEQQLIFEFILEMERSVLDDIFEN